MGEHTLFVGYDLCDEKTQIAVYNTMTFEPDPEGVIPTVITLEQSEDKITNFVSRIGEGEPIIVNGKEADPVKIFSFYFRKTLAITKQKYPNDSIRQLVITVEHQRKALNEVMYAALETLGLEKDRVMIISHKQSYLYYALCQKKRALAERCRNV